MPRSLGDAYQDVVNAARAQVNQDAQGYRLPATPTTRAQAIMALILLLRSAAEEQPNNESYFKGQAQLAAYKFRDASIENILSTAVGLTKSCPRTAELAKDVYTAYRRASTTPSRPARAPYRADVPDALLDVPALPASREAPWRAYAPAAAAIGVGVLALWALWPARRA